MFLTVLSICKVKGILEYMSVIIASITGEIIKDSRGLPTLSITVIGSDGSTGTFAVPSGASTGIHEAYELRDDETGRGNVTLALACLNEEIAPALFGKNIFAQQEIDDFLRKLDGTPNKKRLGGNTLIGVSIALVKAAAKASGKEVWQYLHDTYFTDNAPAFPRLYLNVINGGKHASTKLAFQEYHIVPKTTVMSDALALATQIQDVLHETIAKKFGEIPIGDEGGYALPLTDVEEPLSLLDEVTTKIGVREKVDFALDVAASSFFNADTGQYIVNGMPCDAYTMNALYENLVTTYKLLSIEDPFNEEDFSSFASLPQHVGTMVRVGDDLTTTNKDRLLKAIESKSIDAIIIKPNQIGTFTETIETMKCAREHGVRCIVSHRSGETLDDFISDLAYASASFGIKAGARGPKEREVKYERLLAIEKSLA